MYCQGKKPHFNYFLAPCSGKKKFNSQPLTDVTGTSEIFTKDVDGFPLNYDDTIIKR